MCQFKSWNTVSKHKWGHFTLCKMLLLSSCGYTPRPTTSLTIYIQHETNCTCQQPKPSLAWILPICDISFPIIDQYRYFHTSMMIRSISSNASCFWAIQSKYNLIESAKKKSISPYVAKMFFLQLDEGFRLSGCLIQKYLN